MVAPRVLYRRVVSDVARRPSVCTSRCDVLPGSIPSICEQHLVPFRQLSFTRRAPSVFHGSTDSVGRPAISYAGVSDGTQRLFACLRFPLTVSSGGCGYLSKARKSDKLRVHDGNRGLTNYQRDQNGQSLRKELCSVHSWGTCGATRLLSLPAFDGSLTLRSTRCNRPIMVKEQKDRLSPIRLPVVRVKRGSRLLNRGPSSSPIPQPPFASMTFKVKGTMPVISLGVVSIGGIMSQAYGVPIRPSSSGVAPISAIVHHRATGQPCLPDGTMTHIEGVSSINTSQLEGAFLVNANIGFIQQCNGMSV